MQPDQRKPRPTHKEPLAGLREIVAPDPLTRLPRERWHPPFERSPVALGCLARRHLWRCWYRCFWRIGHLSRHLPKERKRKNWLPLQRPGLLCRCANSSPKSGYCNRHPYFSFLKSRAGILSPARFSVLRQQLILTLSHPVSLRKRPGDTLQQR